MLRSRHTSNRRKAAAVGTFAIFGVITCIAMFTTTRGTAGSQTDAAAHALRELAASGRGSAPVATVNGVPISEITLEIHVVTAELFGVQHKTRQELLLELIDSELLAQAAVRSGISVSEEEVDGAIRSGILDPLASDAVPDDVRAVLVETLRAQGVTPDSALRDPAVRKAYAGLVLRGRYLQSTAQSREEVLLQLREEAAIDILIDQNETKGR